MAEPKENKILCLKAPAKINLHLRVVGRREDGYHLLETVMIPVTLYDEVQIQPGGTGLELKVDPSGYDVPSNEENLVWRAAQAFEKASGRKVRARVTLTKRIPVAAGLGGGSSDAAAVLKGLNQLAGAPLNEADLLKTALELGADVPFFVRGRAAVAKGIGERLSDFALNLPVWFLLVNPGFPVSTAKIFQNLNFMLTIEELQIIVPAVIARESELRSLLCNDLEFVTFSMYPEVRSMHQWLQARSSIGTLMSGSGPTVIALLSTKQEGERLCSEIAETMKNWSCFLVEQENRG